MNDFISIRGARVHNLKNVSLDLPHEKLTVVTGVSGSGKSSLAFDTVYAEGQRRYVESLSSYARQFLERMEKPDVDEIEGIAPPVAIRQKNTTRNPRSTVATATELYDFLRLLWARAGRTTCPECGIRVLRDTVDRVAGRMMAQTEGSRWYALFAVTPQKDNEALRDHLFELRKKGFTRLFQNNRTFEFSTPESLLDIDFTQPVFVLVDRIAISPGLQQRIADTVEICYREGAEAIFHPASEGDPLRFNEKFQCKKCGKEFKEPEPALFSFNSPVGACKRCQGFGNTVDYDMGLIVPDRGLSIDQGAVDPWTKSQYAGYLVDFRKAARGKVRLNVPFFELTEAERDFVRVQIHKFFHQVETKKYKVHVRVFMSRYRGYTECSDCKGSRLRPEALCVRVSEKTMSDVVKLNIAEAQQFFNSLQLSAEETSVAEKVLVEIRQRLKFLNDVGLEYLTLDRLSATLSGGEAQRIQLATCLGSRLVGACYVLDEPSIGLHSRDTERLVGILKELRDLGNTILVVEHDPDVMRAADHIVDLGPGAGEQGGWLVFEGPFSKLIHPSTQTLTARYLRGDMVTSGTHPRRSPNPKRTIHFLGAQIHNVKGIDVSIPLNMMVAVTGVSGSGKSSLVHQVIYENLIKNMNRETPHPTIRNPSDRDEWGLPPEKLTCRKVEKADLLTSVVLVDQSPIGRSPRSNPVTYTKAFDLIRELFARTPEADKRGYTAGHFSFNIPGGRCETCQGDGTVTVEMQFLADVELVCEDCKGTRFKSTVLEVKYHGLNIHEVLRLTVKEALKFFVGAPRLVERMQVLDQMPAGEATGACY